MFEWFKKTKSNYESKDFYKIYIDFPRNELIKRINKIPRIELAILPTPLEYLPNISKELEINLYIKITQKLILFNGSEKKNRKSQIDRRRKTAPKHHTHF